MAIFGGTWDTQNKVAPGSYIKTKSAARSSSTFGDRGVVAFAIEADWGASGVQKITADDLRRNSVSLFGYELSDAKMRNFREVLAEASTLYVYRLNDGGVKAAVTVGKVTYTAKHAGVKGNSIKVIIENDIDVLGNYKVSTLVDSKVIDIQSVKNVSELAANSYVVFSGTGALAVTDLSAGASLTGGTNSAVTAANHSAFLTAIESYDFNILAYAGIDEEIKTLYVAFTERLRSEGVLFQTVLYNKAADSDGIISVKNKAIEEEAGLVYFVAGAEAGCAINKSCTNKKYTGEYTAEAYNKADMIRYTKLGHLVLNVEGSEAVILEDINTFVSVTDVKDASYSKNQVVRVLDQRAKDIADLFFNKYQGKIANDADGRASLWADLVGRAKEMQNLRAIEEYESDDTKVYAGEAKDSVVIVDGIKPTMAMQKLYAEVTTY